MMWRYFEDFWPEVEHDSRWDDDKARHDHQARLAAEEIHRGLGIVCPLEKFAWEVARKADGGVDSSDVEVAKSIRPDTDGNGEVFLVFRIEESDIVWRNY